MFALFWPILDRFCSNWLILSDFFLFLPDFEWFSLIFLAICQNFTDFGWFCLVVLNLAPFCLSFFDLFHFHVSLFLEYCLLCVSSIFVQFTVFFCHFLFSWLLPFPFKSKALSTKPCWNKAIVEPVYRPHCPTFTSFHPPSKQNTHKEYIEFELKMDGNVSLCESLRLFYETITAKSHAWNMCAVCINKMHSSTNHIWREWRQKKIMPKDPMAIVIQWHIQ